MKKFIALIILCIALGTVAVYVIYEKKQEDEWIKLKVGRWRKASVVKKDMNSPEMDIIRPQLIKERRYTKRNSFLMD